MNRFLKKMGFSPNDHVAILHADDVGLCQATLPAFLELFDTGSLTSGSVMVPCPWFPKVASLFAEHPDLDLGIHLTFTSEFSSYRWKPVSAANADSGLIDEHGYFFSTTAEVQQKALPAAVEIETELQLQQAINAGLDITHIDMHMGAMLHQNFLPAYLTAGRKHQIPMFAYRMSTEKMKKWNNPQLASAIQKITHDLEEEGFPVFDNFYQTRLDHPENKMEEIERFFKSATPGLTHFITHPALDTPELRTITPHWKGRVADYEALASVDFKALIKKYNVQLLGYKELRSALRQEITSR